MTKVSADRKDQTGQRVDTIIRMIAKHKQSGKMISAWVNIKDPLIARNLKNIKDLFKPIVRDANVPNTAAKGYTVYSYRQIINGNGKTRRARWEVTCGDITGLEVNHVVTFGSNLAGQFKVSTCPRQIVKNGKNIITVEKNAKDYTPTTGSTTTWTGFSSGTMTQTSGLTNKGLAITLKYGGRYRAQDLLVRTDYVRDFLIVMYTYSKDGNDNKNYYLWDNATSIGPITVNSVPTAIQSFIGSNPLTKAQTDFDATRRFTTNDGYHITIYAAIVRCSRKKKTDTTWKYEWLQKPESSTMKEPYMFSTKVSL